LSLLSLGTGKCEGSIPELGWNYIADLTANNQGGMYTLEDLPYNSVDKACEGLTEELTPVVGLEGWTLLPSNDYKATMNALHKVNFMTMQMLSFWSFHSLIHT